MDALLLIQILNSFLTNINSANFNATDSQKQEIIRIIDSIDNSNFLDSSKSKKDKITNKDSLKFSPKITLEQEPSVNNKSGYTHVQVYTRNENGKIIPHVPVVLTIYSDGYQTVKQMKSNSKGYFGYKIMGKQITDCSSNLDLKIEIKKFKDFEDYRWQNNNPVPGGTPNITCNRVTNF